MKKMASSGFDEDNDTNEQPYEGEFTICIQPAVANC